VRVIGQRPQIAGEQSAEAAIAPRPKSGRYFQVVAAHSGKCEELEAVSGAK
jgi:hypothetical protein